MLTASSNYRLVICGLGELNSLVENATKQDSRIIYKGVLPHEEAVLLQQNATALINPRQPSATLTKYSFPSKTIEYLLSGTPMIGYHLEGIPDEYYEYFFTPSDLTIEALTDTINKVFSMSNIDLYYKAKNAQQFIIENKTAVTQVKKMLTYLSK